MTLTQLAKNVGYTKQQTVQALLFLAKNPSKTGQKSRLSQELYETIAAYAPQQQSSL